LFIRWPRQGRRSPTLGDALPDHDKSGKLLFLAFTDLGLSSGGLISPATSISAAQRLRPKKE
jgi:hypothetical protein